MQLAHQLNNQDQLKHHSLKYQTIWTNSHSTCLLSEQSWSTCTLLVYWLNTLYQLTRYWFTKNNKDQLAHYWFTEWTIWINSHTTASLNEQSGLTHTLLIYWQNCLAKERGWTHMPLWPPSPPCCVLLHTGPGWQTAGPACFDLHSKKTQSVMIHGSAMKSIKLKLIISNVWITSNQAIIAVNCSCKLNQVKCV